MKKLLNVLTGLCLLAGAFTGCDKPNENEDGGGTASIQGKVTDKETGESLGGVLIYPLQPDDVEVSSAGDGTYIIENLKAGIYTIKAVKDGYLDYTKENVRLVAGQTTTLNVEMEAENDMELEITDEYGDPIEELDCGIEGSFYISNEGDRKGEWSIEYDADCIAEISPASGILEAYACEEITVKRKLFKEDRKTVITIKTKKEDLQLPVAIKGFEMEVVYVTGGEFEMGATEEQGDDANEEREKPVRTVRLDSYYIGKYEVTQAQWQAVMGKDLHGLDYEYGKGDDYPQYYVTWEDAQKFCKLLSEATGNKSQHYKYAGSDDIDEVAWYGGGEFATAHPVGTKKANELGIYDMSGNVEEWCSDWYGKYDENDTENPQGPTEGYASQRVYRGGYWWSSAYYCRVSYRDGGYPGNSFSSSMGFRVVYLP